MQVVGPAWLEPRLAALLAELGLTGEGVACAQVTGDDPVEPTSLRLGAAMALGHLCFGAAIAELAVLTHQRPAQHLAVDVAAAVCRIFPERTGAVRVNGRIYPQALLRFNPLLQTFYEARCGSLFVPSALYPEGLLAWLRTLGCGATHEAIAAAIRGYDAAELEALAAQQQLPGVMVRTFDAYCATAQGKHEAALPRVVLEEEGEKGAFSPGWQPQPHRPLAGLRVVTFCRAIAGPILARTLAEQGADVVHIVMPGSFEHDAVHFEVGIAARSVALDLRDERDLAEARRLVAAADCVVDNLRAGALLRCGIDLRALAPLSAVVRSFDEEGPWGERVGFDMTAMAASGMTLADVGKAGAPKWPPTKLFCDFAAGLYGAAGVVAALCRQLRTHRRMRVRTSLSRMGVGCLQLGLLAPDEQNLAAASKRPAPELRFASPYGEMLRYGPVLSLSHTPCRWEPVLLTPRGSGDACRVWQ